VIVPRLLDFHERGLSACIGLMKLALTESVFLAAMPEETLAVGSRVEFNISASMSNLTQLSRLSIELATRQPIDFCLDYIIGRPRGECAEYLFCE